jgi:hypothetical protein
MASGNSSRLSSIFCVKSFIVYYTDGGFQAKNRDCFPVYHLSYGYLSICCRSDWKLSRQATFKLTMAQLPGFVIQGLILAFNDIHYRYNQPLFFE